MNEYIVLGPVMERGAWNSIACATEPLEKYRPYVEVEAPNARAAIKMAMADPQFEDIAETSDTVPWKYVRAIRHPHVPPEHKCVDLDDHEADEKPDACPVCTAWDARIKAVEDQIDTLRGKGWE